MREEILSLLSLKNNKTMKLEDISSKLKIDKESLRELLRGLEVEGLVYRDKKGRYMLVSNTDLRKGIIKFTKRKGIIVVFEDDSYDVVSYKDYKTLEEKDVVLVSSLNGTAKVVKILERATHDFVGEVVKERHKYMLKARDSGNLFPLDTILPIGTMVLIDGRDLTIKEIIGHKDDVGTREKEILTTNGFPISFSSEYLKEMEGIPSFVSEEEVMMEKKRGVVDLRNIPLVTIDGDDTKDFDDAVGVYNGNFYVSIVNVSKYVKYGGVIWNTTMERGISVYPPGMVNPYLHHYISNGICSLIPCEDRFAITCIMKIDSEGKVTSYRIVPSIINSKMRMTYSSVNEYLEKNNVLPSYEGYTKMLDQLSATADLVRDRMLRDGFLDFSSTEVKIILNGDRTVDVKKRYQGMAENLIEFLMIIHNLTVTDYFIKHKLPFIARNHGDPNVNKLSLWNRLLRQRGYKAPGMKDGSNKEISDRLSLYKDSREKVILDSYAIRSQAKAKYGAYNIGHFAIGVGAYATFSSPVRRCDLINQKIFTDSLEYGDAYAREKWYSLLPKLAMDATDSERRADIVEKKITSIRKAQYMEKFIGYNFEALVAEVSREYIKVLLPNMVTGRVFISSYEYSVSKDGFMLISNKTKERILVGDVIRVRVDRVDTYNGEVYFLREGYKANTYDDKKKKIKKR